MFTAWDVGAAITSANTDVAPFFAPALLVILTYMTVSWGFRQVRKFGFTSAG